MCHTSNPHSPEVAVAATSVNSHSIEHTSITSHLPSAGWQTEKMRALRETDCDPRMRAFAIREIVEAFHPYVLTIARYRWKQFCRIGGQDGLSDILSAGRHALLASIERWSAAHDKPLSCLASRWITHACKQEAIALSARAVRLPHKVQKLCSRYRTLQSTSGPREAERMLGQSRTQKRTQQVVRELSENFQAAPLSLDAGVNGNTAGETDLPTLHDTLADGSCIGADIERRETLALIRTVLIKRCSARDRFLFYMLHPFVALDPGDIGDVRDSLGNAIEISSRQIPSEGWTAAMLAKRLLISRERVRQLLNEVNARLRAELFRVGCRSA